MIKIRDEVEELIRFVQMRKKSLESTMKSRKESFEKKKEYIRHISRFSSMISEVEKLEEEQEQLKKVIVSISDDIEELETAINVLKQNRSELQNPKKIETTIEALRKIGENPPVLSFQRETDWKKKLKNIVKTLQCLKDQLLNQKNKPLNNSASASSS